MTGRGGEGFTARFLPHLVTVLAFVALGCLSAVLAVVGAFHSTSVLGVLIAVVGNLALGIGGAWAMRNRAVPAVTGAVWVLVALLLSDRGPGHDTVVGSIDGRPEYGVAYLIGGVVAVAIAVGLVTSRRWGAWMAAQRLHPAGRTADDNERDHVPDARSGT